MAKSAANLEFFATDLPKIMREKEKPYIYRLRRRGKPMARYHLYFLRQGMLVDSGCVEAANDREAARLAAERSDGRMVEVWNSSRRVRVVAPVRTATLPPSG